MAIHEDLMEYTTVTNPPEAHPKRKNPMKEMIQSDAGIEKPKMRPNYNRGLGTTAIIAAAIGSGLVVKNLTDMAVNRNLYNATWGGIIQTLLGLLGGFGLAAVGQERTGAAVGAALGSLGTLDLWEEAQLKMSQSATPTPTATPSTSGTRPGATTPPQTTAAAGARLPQQQVRPGARVEQRQRQAA